MHILELTLIFIAAEIPLLILGALMLAAIQLRQPEETTMTKNAPRNMALLSVIGNLVLLGTGFDFMYSLQHDKRWTWLQIVAAAIIVSSQAPLPYRRGPPMQHQHA